MKSNLKQIRKEAGITLQQLADKSGVTQSHISKLEKDGCNPTMKTALFISGVLGVSIFDIWEEKE